MQLPPGQRSILASFPSTEAAQKAADALRKAGYEEIQIDRISRYGTSFNAEYNNPVNNAISQGRPYPVLIWNKRHGPV